MITNDLPDTKNCEWCSAVIYRFGRLPYRWKTVRFCSSSCVGKNAHQFRGVDTDSRYLLGNEHRKTHGYSPKDKTSPTYKSWQAMKTRCTNPNTPGWSRYGGRGITVCDQWSGPHAFPQFLADMGERPEGTTLHRIDGDGNYEPDNCKWATPMEQSIERDMRTVRSGR